MPSGENQRHRRPIFNPAVALRKGPADRTPDAARVGKVVPATSGNDAVGGTTNLVNPFASGNAKRRFGIQCATGRGGSGRGASRRESSCSIYAAAGPAARRLTINGA